MNFRIQIAVRYLLSKREAGFITVISAISILGITIGVAALIVVLSVFNGFNSLVTDILVGFDPHVRIQISKSTSQNELVKVEQYLAQKNIPGVAKFVSGKVMMISKKMTKVVYLRGIEATNLNKVSGVEEKLVFGNSNLVGGSPKIIFGLSLADRLDVETGDSVYVLSSAGAQNVLLNNKIPQLQSFKVQGIYESNNKDYDGLYSFTSLEAAQKLLQTTTIHGFDIRFHSINEVDGFTSDFQKTFSQNFSVYTWYDLHKDLYSVMQVERWTAFIILTLIIIVATFNMLGSLIMTVIEKTRDVGILKAMGATENDIKKIFRFEGLLIGVVGSLTGTMLGLFVCWLQINYQLFSLDTNVYIIPALPVEIRISDIIIVAVSTIVLCYGATTYPAKRASLLQPAEAVRWE